jgi:hypothetical protein
MPHYNISDPVLRQVESELNRRAAQNESIVALQLADALWNDNYFECKLLACSLIGVARTGDEKAITERIQTWAQPDEDGRIIRALFKAGKTHLGKENPERWLQQIILWISADSIPVQGLGLRALQTILTDPEFENLPRIYKLLIPLAASAPPALHPDLTRVIEILAQRSKSETVSFLKYVLVVASNSQITRLIRRCLPFFDEDDQKKLRLALAQKSA